MSNAPNGELQFKLFNFKLSFVFLGKRLAFEKFKLLVSPRGEISNLNVNKNFWNLLLYKEKQLWNNFQNKQGLLIKSCHFSSLRPLSELCTCSRLKKRFPSRYLQTTHFKLA